MIIVWGTRYFGKVDEVPGLFHVATRFGHLWYIPLIPMGSMVVVGKEGDSISGVKIPLSAKSMFIAWGRALGVVASLVLLMVAIGSFSPKSHVDTSGRVISVGLFVAALVGTILLWTLRVFRRASYERALHLGQLIELSDEGRIILELRMGRISEADAKRHLESAAADRAELERLEAETKQSER